MWYIRLIDLQILKHLCILSVSSTWSWCMILLTYCWIWFTSIHNIACMFTRDQFSSVAQSCLTLRSQESQHARPPCPSLTPRVYSNSCPSSQWCHPAISSSVIPFSSCPQSFPALGSFQMSQPFAWGGQSIGVSASASVLPMNTQDWSPLGWMVGSPCCPRDS